ncbi:hypothetical protein BDQ17DRAFT_1360896 [Cyathus striatus]|nr:hypothetical protein BDQ17DRAFT_1360896 [Cyathus striatus]
MHDKVATYFISDGDDRGLRPSLTLRDSNQGNIFLSREAFERDGTMEISAIIDWQHTAVLPLYLTALISSFIELADRAPGQEKGAFFEERAYLHKAYRVLYQETDLDIAWASALSFDGKVTMAQQLPSAAQYCWHGGYPKLKRRLIRTMVEWEAIAGPVISPESFSEEDMTQIHEDEWAWGEMEIARSDIAERIGVNDDGWVATDGYDSAVQVNDDLRKKWMANVENDDLGGVDPVDIWLF